jgi:Rho-binding antiterminator
MDNYHPINCEFHDVLEAQASTRQWSEISYRDNEGHLRTAQAVILDVYARDGAEYLVLDSGETLRLDRIVAVNSIRLSDF